MVNRLAVAALILLCATGLAGQTLTISFTDSNAEPYAIVTGGQLTGGVIKDIGDALGRELGVKIEYVRSNPVRLEEELRAGTIAMRPIWNPAWTRTPNDYLWSSPLFPETNLFAYAKARPLTIKSFEDLKGKAIGTIQGYFYPTLQPYFDRKDMSRNDVQTLQQNLDKLKAAGEIDRFLAKYR